MAAVVLLVVIIIGLKNFPNFGSHLYAMTMLDFHQKYRIVCGGLPFCTVSLPY